MGVRDKLPRERLTMSGPATYRVTVRGTLGPSLSGPLSDMNITERYSQDGDVETLLVGRLPDQAALSSVLNALYELNRPVVSVECLESG